MAPTAAFVVTVDMQGDDLHCVAHDDGNVQDEFWFKAGADVAALGERFMKHGWRHTMVREQTEGGVVCQHTDCLDAYTSLIVSRDLSELMQFLRSCWRLGYPKQRLSEVEVAEFDKITELEVTVDTLPEDIDALKALRILYFRRSSFNCTTRLPTSITGLTALERLIFHGDNELVELPEIICKLKTVKHLSIVECRKFSVPDIICEMEHLEHLEICACPAFAALPKDLGKLKALVHLSVLVNTAFRTLPESVCELINLKHLKVDYCSQFTTLPQGLGRLEALEELSLEGCFNLVALPDGVRELKSLRYLTVPDSFPEAEVEALRRRTSAAVSR